MPSIFGPNMNKAYTTVATSRKFWESEKVTATKHGANTKVFVLNYGPAIDKALKVANAVVSDCQRRGGVSGADLAKLETEFKKVNVISDKYRKICTDKTRSDAANADAWKMLGKATVVIDLRFAAIIEGLQKASGNDPKKNERDAVQASRQARGRA